MGASQNNAVHFAYIGREQTAQKFHEILSVQIALLDTLCQSDAGEGNDRLIRTPVLDQMIVLVL